MVNINKLELDCLKAGKTIKPKKKNKYNAVKETTGGIRFDSSREAKRYCKLKIQEHCGFISDLKTQVEYILLDAFEYKGEKIRKLSYFADFEYKKDGVIITEDSKGFKTQVYKLKRKMLLSRYPDINFIET